MDAILTLDARSELIGSISDFAYKWGLNAGLSEADSLEFTLAVDELVSDIVLFAFPDHPGRFHIRFKRDLSMVEVVINEMGEPFDPDRHQYDPQEALLNNNFDGAGLILMHIMTDDFVFINKGKEGKEFRINKRIRDQHITEMEQIVHMEPSAPLTTAPTQYEVREVTPDDAEDVARLIYRTYEYSYTKEELYFPKKIERALRQNEKLGVIVRSDDGAAVGNFAVIRMPDSDVAEVAEAVVSPSHRQRGIMTRMMQALIDISIKHDILGLYGFAVTPHPISQRVNAKYGFKSTGLMLAESPAVIYKKLHETYPQPVSIIVDFKCLQEPRPLKLYIPQSYESLILDIYHNLGMPVEKASPKAIEWMHQSDIQIEIDYKDNTALLVTREIGKDFKQTLGKITGSLAVKKLNTIYLDLPMEDPAILHVIEDAQDIGFIFCGVFPLIKTDRHYLRLQKVLVSLDFSLIEVYSKMAQRIKAHIRKEYHARRTK
jgi:anti-sigma regulatory factor (Ser/Thr protein kinase)/RimJ/RimL family protein N-acetyltransferase